MPADHAYDYAFRPRLGRESRRRNYGRPWDDRAELDERMGLHDLSEHYGRYSGGRPYGYEYSERSIEHRHAGRGGTIGFTRPLEGGGWARSRQGRLPVVRRRRRGVRSSGYRPWYTYAPQSEREAFNAPRADAPWDAYPPRRGRDRF